MLFFDPTTLPPTIIGFLQLLAASSGAIVSWFFALVPQLQRLPPWVQGIANFLLSAALTALLTWATSAANPGTIDKLNAFYVLIVQLLITFAGNLGFHVVYHGIIHPTVKWYQAKVAVPSGSKG